MPFEDLSFMGYNSTHLLNESTAIIKCTLFFVLFGKFVARSIAIVKNGVFPLSVG